MQRIATVPSSGIAELPKAQRMPPLDLAHHLQESGDRDRAVQCAYLASGITMSAIARELGLSVSRISRIVAAAYQAKGKT
jgi:DNA-binding NarL/FixJ family response regulator